MVQPPVVQLGLWLGVVLPVGIGFEQVGKHRRRVYFLFVFLVWSTCFEKEDIGLRVLRESMGGSTPRRSSPDYDVIELGHVITNLVKKYGSIEFGWQTQQEHGDHTAVGCELPHPARADELAEEVFRLQRRALQRRTYPLGAQSQQRRRPVTT